MATHSDDDDVELTSGDHDLDELLHGDAVFSDDDTDSTEEDDETDTGIQSLLGNGGQEEISDDEISKINELIELTKGHEIEDRKSGWKQIHDKIYESNQVGKMVKGALLHSLVNLHRDSELTCMLLNVLYISVGSDEIEFNDEEIGLLVPNLKDIVKCGEHEIVHEALNLLALLVAKHFVFGPIVANAIASKMHMLFTIDQFMEFLKTNQVLKSFSENKMIVFILIVGHSNEFLSALMDLESLECTTTSIGEFKMIDNPLVHKFMLGCAGVNGPFNVIGEVIGSYFSQVIIRGGHALDVGDSFKKMLRSGEGVKVKNILIAITTMANAGFVVGNIAIKGIIEDVFSTVMRILRDSTEVEAIRTLKTIMLYNPFKVKHVNNMMYILNNIAAYLGSKPQEIKDLIRSEVVSWLIRNVKRDPHHDPIAVAEVERRLAAA